MKRISAFLMTGALSSCSSLEVPGSGRPIAGREQAMRVLERSVRMAGDPWRGTTKVEVAYEGEWTGVVKRLQPVLVDGEFRSKSVEVYEPRLGRVSQIHHGPGGKKSVERSAGEVEVAYEGVRHADDEEVRDAAALVADAYTAFLFGASWLREKGTDLVLLEAMDLHGETCDRVQGRLSPGFGFSEQDDFIAWIGRESGLMQRLQFTINGLESTRGADVQVSFFDHWKAKDGDVWPGRFVEWVERPVRVKAHEWRMTKLTVDGNRLK